MTRGVVWASVLVLGGCQQIGDLGRSQWGSGSTESADETQSGEAADNPNSDGRESETGVLGPTFQLVGSDVTYRNLLQDLGAQFFDRGGEPRDVLEVLRDEGVTLARIRVYHDPGTPTVFVEDGEVRTLQEGYQDLADAQRTATDARALGMSLFLTLHYSDFWTQRRQQVIPAAWQDLPFAELSEAFHAETARAVETLGGDDGVVAYVALGSSINEQLMGFERGSDEYVSLLERGIQAVREVAPSAKIVLHLDTGDVPSLDAWIGDPRLMALDYDVLGLSLYPFWTGWTIERMREEIERLAQQTGRAIVICEFGVLWTGASQGPYPPMGGEDFPITPEGQRDYIAEYMASVRASGVVEAALYWDPIWIEWPGAGWVDGEGNSEWDATLFDPQGYPLPGLSVLAH